MCQLIEANAPVGPGDRFIADLVGRVSTPKILVVNKVDIAGRDEIGEQLVRASTELGDFDALRAGLGPHAATASTRSSTRSSTACPRARTTTRTASSRISPRRRSWPSCCASSCWPIARDELPHSIAVTAEPLDDDDSSTAAGADPGDERRGGEEVLRYRAVVRVERDSQKGIVIGKGGSVIRDAGTKARLELERLLGARVYLETAVRVDKEWQRRAHALDRLGPVMGRPKRSRCGPDRARRTSCWRRIGRG